ncbi:MAG: HAD-IIA family hydrolase [Gemmatimonadota bacterium]
MPKALLLDLDGTLYSGGAPIAGVAAALAAIRHRGVPCRFLTNTTSASRAGLVERLRSFGFEVSASEIVTPLVSATALLKAEGIRRVMPFVPGAALADLAEFELTGGTAGEGGWGEGGNAHGSSIEPGVPVVTASSTSSAVLIGDLGPQWSFDLMQSAFEALNAGARFLALSRDRYFQSAGGLRLDAGAFVTGLEYATGRTADIMGKPSMPYYHQALASLGAGWDPADVVMVGDDLWSDIQGAQRAGCQGWLVRTGKFREETLRDSGIVPDRIIASAAELMELLA